MPEPAIKLSSSQVAADGLDEAFDYMYRRGMTDGLPIIPPTEDRVRRMVEAGGRAPDELVGKVPPSAGEATVEKIAVNAVMAGCLPEYMPVVLAAVEAMLEDPFELHGIQTTTNAVTVGLIINGPIRKKLQINCESGCMGPGWRANATIGRVIRLILINLGGGTPPDVDKSTQGYPGKYTLCFGENEEESPWPPLHVERGFRPEQSCVTVIAPNSSFHWTFSDRLIATEGLRYLVEFIKTCANNQFGPFIRGEPLMAFNPIHAAELGKAGFSKDDVKRYLDEHCRYPLERLTPGARENRLAQPHLIRDGVAPMVRDWRKYMIVVAGGDGGLHSTFMPAWDHPLSITKPIRETG